MRTARHGPIWVAVLCAAGWMQGARAQEDAPALAGFEQVKAGYEALQAWQYDDARRIASKLYEERPQDPMVLALLADVKLHHGDYRGAVELFDRVEDAGLPPVFRRHEELARAALETTQGYTETVSDHFILRHAPGRDWILRPYAAETLEKALDRLSSFLGFRPEGRILVEFYPSALTLAKVSSLTPADIENSGTIALCKWNRLMVTTPRGVAFGYAWRDTLSHELAHLLIGGASRNEAPIWLHEGLAKFVETAWRGEPGLGISVEQQQALRKAAQEDTLISFEDMHPSMAKLPSQEQTSLAFAEVFTFIEYLVDQGGWSAIREVLVRIGEGTPDREAIGQVFGTDFETLEARWKETLPDRPIQRPQDGRLVKGARRIQLKSEPDEAEDPLEGLDPLTRRFARAADLLYARGRIPAALTELTKAYDREPNPQLASKLAQIALEAGDLKTAESAARTALEEDVGLAGPHVTLAEILVRREKYVAARAPLQRAIDINPFDPRIHRLTLAIERELEQDPATLEHAQRALEYMTEPVRLPPRRRSGSARVQIDGPRFARVFVAKEGQSFEATQTVAPTPVLELDPGRVTIRYVPPEGPAIEKDFIISPNVDGVQRLAAEPRGS